MRPGGIEAQRLKVSVEQVATVDFPVGEFGPLIVGFSITIPGLIPAPPSATDSDAPQ